MVGLRKRQGSPKMAQGKVSRGKRSLIGEDYSLRGVSPGMIPTGIYLRCFLKRFSSIRSLNRVHNLGIYRYYFCIRSVPNVGCCEESFCVDRFFF